MESDESSGESTVPVTPVDPIRENMLQVYPANLGFRAVAFILDCVMVGAVFYLVTTTILYPFFHPGFTSALREFMEEQQHLPADTGFREMMETQLEFQLEHQNAIAETQFLYIVVLWVYFAMSEILMRGSTLGKKIFKLQTIDLKTLKRPTGKVILIRNCLKTISMTILFPLLLVNFIIPFFNRFRLAGHDLITKTMTTYEHKLPPSALNDDS